MKKLVKILSVVLIAALLLVLLTGCGNTSVNDDTTGNKTTGTQEKVAKVKRGIWSNDLYTNDFANISFKLPTNWTIASDEEIAEMMNVGAELLSDNQQKFAELAEQMSVYDMVANDPTTGASVMVMFEKTTLKVSEDFYLGNLKKGLEEVEAFNYEINSNYETQTIGGEQYKVLTAKIPEYHMVQKYYVRQIGNYFADILVTYIEDFSDINTIMSNFQ